MGSETDEGPGPFRDRFLKFFADTKKDLYRGQWKRRRGVGVGGSAVVAEGSRIVAVVPGPV